MKDELEEILNILHISREHLEDEVLGLRIIDEFYKISNKKKNSDGYMILVLGYARLPFRDFESFLRIVVALDEENLHLNLKQYKSQFITFEISPGIYTIQVFSDAVLTFAGHNEILEIEYDDSTMKTKLILKNNCGKFFTL